MFTTSHIFYPYYLVFCAFQSFKWTIKAIFHIYLYYLPLFRSPRAVQNLQLLKTRKPSSHSSELMDQNVGPEFTPYNAIYSDDDESENKEPETKETKQKKYYG